jgi:hypothetical protein
MAGTLRQFEQQLVRPRENLAHLDANMRFFNPKIQMDIRPKRPGVCNVRPVECLR